MSEGESIEEGEMYQRQPLEIEFITESRRHYASQPELREREKTNREIRQNDLNPLITIEQPGTDQAELNVHQNHTAHIQLQVTPALVPTLTVMAS